MESHHYFQAAGLSVPATDGPAAGFDASPHDGQAETDSPSLARAGIVHSKEWIEQSGQKLLRYSGTAVGHLDHDIFWLACCRQSDRTASSGITDRVSQQIRNGSLQEIRVGHHFQVRFDFQLNNRAILTFALHGLLGYGLNVDRPQLEFSPGQ